MAGELVFSRCQDCDAYTKVRIGDRIWCLNPDHPPTPLTSPLSQGELLNTLRGVAHIARPYPISQLIRDVEELTPGLLDSWVERRKQARLDDFLPNEGGSFPALDRAAKQGRYRGDPAERRLRRRLPPQWVDTEEDDPASSAADELEGIDAPADRLNEDAGDEHLHVVAGSGEAGVAPPLGRTGVPLDPAEGMRAVRLLGRLAAEVDRLLTPEEMSGNIAIRALVEAAEILVTEILAAASFDEAILRIERSAAVRDEEGPDSVEKSDSLRPDGNVYNEP